MKIELPKSKIPATRVNPKSMVIFSQPKVGKTTICAELDNSLIIDVEDGSEFVDAVKINVLELTKEQSKEKGKEILPIQVLKGIIDTIKEANKERGDYVYKVGILDTVTALEPIVLPLAKKLYKATTMGRNWMGDDVTTLPNGAGYGYTRKALAMIISELEELFDTLIILGHVKAKDVEKNGEEMTVRGLDLTGKSASILCSQVDAVGYMYRDDDDNTVINFASSESLQVGSRSEHLKGRKITVATNDQDGNLNVDWSGIFKK